MAAIFAENLAGTASAVVKYHPRSPFRPSSVSRMPCLSSKHVTNSDLYETITEINVHHTHQSNSFS